LTSWVGFIAFADCVSVNEDLGTELSRIKPSSNTPIANLCRFDKVSPVVFGLVFGL